MADPLRIILTRAPFGLGFDVETVPPLHSAHREFRHHRDAYGWASGLRLTHGGVISDQTGENPHE